MNCKYIEPLRNDTRYEIAVESCRADSLIFYEIVVDDMGFGR